MCEVTGLHLKSRAEHRAADIMTSGTNKSLLAELMVTALN